MLQYSNGSPCDGHHQRRSSALVGRRLKDPKEGKDRDKDDDRHDRKSKDSRRRKSTLISLLCERDALAPKATVAFVGASPDDCAYFFEIRSPHACGGVSSEPQAIGPGGVFGVM